MRVSSTENYMVEQLEKNIYTVEEESWKKNEENQRVQ